MSAPTVTRAQAGAASLAAAGLVLLVTACGGSSSKPPAASAPQNPAVAFATCMRSHEVPNWPDPNSSGVFDKSKLTPEQLGASASRVQAAQAVCQHLLPTRSAPSAAQVQQVRAQALSYSQCVRSHGVPNFPDPASDGRIPDPASVGINQGSPKFEAANQACGTYRPPYMPSNAAYNAYARAHGG
ncbi:MAG TPA: hypothetical protein VG652_02120 [Gaiellaceae bacterium]|nr:hypothetical protein [Gaiellaceae bacterium]